MPLFQPALNEPDPTTSDSVLRVLRAGTDAVERPFLIANGRQQFCTDGLRYVADDGTLIDIYGTDRVEITPGNAWNGEPPAAFYGTATAALLAMRGDLPMHGSAVELDGKAVLLCGHSGAGKSTLTAALIAAGARLLSDDLSGVRLTETNGDPVLFSGRKAIRLFPDVAGFLGEKVPTETVQHPGEPKALAMPPTASPDRPFRLSAVVILGEDRPMQAPEAAGLRLLEFSFRRRAFRHLAGFERRVEIARRIAGTVPVLTLPGVQARTGEAFRAAADKAFKELASAGFSG